MRIVYDNRRNQEITHDLNFKQKIREIKVALYFAFMRHIVLSIALQLFPTCLFQMEDDYRWLDKQLS